MANRSYLYASNFTTGATSPEQRNTTGISEWNYDIPLAYKILLSGNPMATKSSIWIEAGEIAIVGDYSLGVRRLSEFLDKITQPGFLPLKHKALEFLDQNRRTHFVLECGEIFDMGDDELELLNSQLLGEIRNLEPQIAQALQAYSSPIEPPAPVVSQAPSWFAKIFRTQPAAPAVADLADPLERFYELGLGNWSNILYFDLRGV